MRTKIKIAVLACLAPLCHADPLNYKLEVTPQEASLIRQFGELPQSPDKGVYKIFSAETAKRLKTGMYGKEVLSIAGFPIAVSKVAAGGNGPSPESTIYWTYKTKSNLYICKFKLRSDLKGLYLLKVYKKDIDANLP